MRTVFVSTVDSALPAYMRSRQWEGSVGQFVGPVGALERSVGDNAGKEEEAEWMGNMVIVVRTQKLVQLVQVVLRVVVYWCL